MNKSQKKLNKEFLRSYFESNVWYETTFLGVRCLKSVADLWNYQEIIFELKPSLIIEFGTYYGGSTLFFASLLDLVNHESKIISVDLDHSNTDPKVKNHPKIELLTSSSVDSSLVDYFTELRKKNTGKAFVIIDSDHHKEHVLAEMNLLRNVLIKGDYLVVEDGIVNGNPIMPEFGEGPLEAINEYILKYPEDFVIDYEREKKFGFTFAPSGYLIKK